MKDPFTVFDKIKGTPKYWQKVKFDMIAKLENIGPFQWFFTLSCGDKRWSNNFTPILEKLGCKINYHVDKEGREQVHLGKYMQTLSHLLFPILPFIEPFK